MAGRFVRTANLEKLHAAVGKVLASANVTAMKLEAFKYYYIPSKDVGGGHCREDRPRDCSS